MDVNEELKFLYLKKKIGGGGGNQGECEQRFEVFVKMEKKIGGGGGGGGLGVGFTRSGWISEDFCENSEKLELCL